MNSSAFSPSTHRPSRGRLVAAGVALAVAVAGFVGVSAGSASAEGTEAPQLPVASATDGWMRVAHLSPDTKAVNVTLTSVMGGQKIVELDDVAYGSVSPYIHVPSGTYIVAMTPWKTSGSGSTAKPMVSASVEIVTGKTITIAAFGKNKKLKAKVFQDDLTSPAAGGARIRLIQASTTTKSVNVKTSSGILIASKAQAGQATSYATVPAGPWTLDVSAKKVSDSSEVQLAQGTVSTLFVLDNAAGGLTVKTVLDSAGVGQDPVGGVQTGGGWAADHGQLDVGEGTR